MNTGLKPIKRFTHTPKGSDNVKTVLRTIKKLILEHLFQNKPKPLSAKDLKIQSIILILKESILVAIPTDKTNTGNSSTLKITKSKSMNIYEQQQAKFQEPISQIQKKEPRNLQRSMNHYYQQMKVTSFQKEFNLDQCQLPNSY